MKARQVCGRALLAFELHEHVRLASSARTEATQRPSTRPARARGRVEPSERQAVGRTLCLAFALKNDDLVEPSADEAEARRQLLPDEGLRPA